MTLQNTHKKLNIKRFILGSISFILFFGYIYNFQIVGFPFSTIKILALLGFIFISIQTFYKRKHTFNSYLLVLIAGMLIPAFCGGISLIINSEKDLSLLREIFNLPYYLIAFYCIKFYKNRTKENITFNDIALMFIVTGFIQSVISLIGFLNPDFGNLLVGIQEFGDEYLRARAEHSILYKRLIGLGTRYWAGGIIFSIDLVLITQLMTDKSNYNRVYYKYLPLFYFIIFIVGMMMSRTTIIGLLFSLMYSLKYSYKLIIRIFKYTLPYIFILSLFFYYLVYSYEDRFQKIFTFGFELFINLFSSGEFQSTSTNSMLKMYKFPELDNYKTWLIGDALFNNPTSSGYYKDTDIGYCRSIYYFGLIGLFSLLFTQFCVLLKLSKRLNKKYRFFVFIIGMMFLTFNLKGFSLCYFYIIPFLFIDKANSLANCDDRSLKYA